MAEGRFRQRSVESVIKIVKTVVANFGVKRLRFEHDLLTLNRKWIFELCDALIQRKARHTVELFLPNRHRG